MIVVFHGYLHVYNFVSYRNDQFMCLFLAAVFILRQLTETRQKLTLVHRDNACCCLN